jgi:iron complex outermembrane recepter protein
MRSFNFLSVFKRCVSAASSWPPACGHFRSLIGAQTANYSHTAQERTALTVQMAGEALGRALLSTNQSFIATAIAGPYDCNNAVGVKPGIEASPNGNDDAKVMFGRPLYGKSAIQAEEKSRHSVEGGAINYLKIIRSGFLSGAALIGFGISATNAQQSGTAVSNDVSQIGQAGTQASSQAQASGPTEQVVVSASRISIAGYQAPTPVTVVGSEQLERDALPDIGDALRQLPAVGSSSGPNNAFTASDLTAADAGVDEVNLRQLGILRTLVLFDGQRVIASNITGGVDLSTIPSSLVQRIDVVTGGASAAWGSDAVAGVVNLVVNKEFRGFEANIEGGDTTQFDQPSGKFDASYGTDFLGNRGHIILSGSYVTSPDTLVCGQRSWCPGEAKLVNNPLYVAGNGQPQLIHANNIGYSDATQGGVITSGPLAGTQFVGPTGTPAPFNSGNYSGEFSNGGNVETAAADLGPFVTPYRTLTLFNYNSYQITPSIKASIELNYGVNSLEADSPDNYSQLGTITIHQDNAYLDPSIAARMSALGLQTFSLGTTNLNNLPTNGNSLLDTSVGAQAASLGIPALIHRQLLRGVASLDGSLGNDWSWNAYYQHGEVRVRDRLLSNIQTSAYTNAIDAVRVTAANVGNSGLPIGEIACRSTLTNPTNGCQPLDLFGDDVASPGAIQYITGAARAGNDSELIITNQDVASASLQGQLPWGLPAGPIALATGAEYREEAGRVTASAMAAAKDFAFANFAPFAGHYDVAEGFLEINAPILKDSIVQSLDFNGAGRLTSYSTSGLVETWKLGITSQVSDDLRLRSSWSFDIRAPNLSELFNPGTFSGSEAIDPHSGKTVPIFFNTSGNANLQPEQSTTVSGGVVLTPHWVEGLTISADWYSISINKAIASFSAASIDNQCIAGVASACSLLVFGGPGGALSQINVIPINANNQTVSGLDFQSDFQTEFLYGNLDLHLIGNYTDEQTQTTAVTTFDYAGSLGYDSTILGVPKFKLTAAATYQQDAWSLTIQGRMIGSGKLNNAWTSLNVDNNNVPAIGYLDARASYSMTDYVQLYAAVDNVLDANPPNVATDAVGDGDIAHIPRDNRCELYDCIGRSFRIGVRFKN